MDSSTHLYALLTLICMKKHGLIFQSMLPQMPILSGFIDSYGDLWIYETGAAFNDTQLHIRLISLLRQYICRVIDFEVLPHVSTRMVLM